jgi:hypothetical protein
MAIAGTAETSIGGIPVPANPQIKVFDITALDADTGPTNVAHGMLNVTSTSLAWIIPTVTGATTVIPNWSVTLTSTNIVLSKNNVAGSGGTTPGTTVVIRVVVFNPNTVIM